MQEAALQRYDVVMLDEAHDCTAAQISIVERASCAKLVVYDPHQCIYQFRGAEPGNFARLPADFQALTLVDNYRSSANVLAVAGPNPSLKPEPEPEPKPKPNPQPQPESQP